MRDVLYSTGVFLSGTMYGSVQSCTSLRYLVNEHLGSPDWWNIAHDLGDGVEGVFRLFDDLLRNVVTKRLLSSSKQKDLYGSKAAPKRN